MDKSQKWLDELSGQTIPRSIFKISYSCSSGKGGQKVNKTSSKATVSMAREDWDSAYWIPKPVMQQLQTKGFRYQTETGNVVIQSDSTRSRYQNTDLCFEKLADEIRATVYFPKETTEETVEKWNQIKEFAKTKRLEQKKRHGRKKADRKSTF
ncbi:hypothetical protein BABINDRAFT_160792 [Babjeviella inositovora NRRL Y-12698]|uniref:Prokaryotic-type class I peptide chain release factors domain-containing protein n=1 Tax=Babjeviella inositovora NRRL Y-12698 TaxID=984486 RepID=A0A1E3QUA5_9ASCO|nr:uncharacterized protein BABINDRAFT_160792 [Babjeviella inositovora NRRL Y-12698]ODQ80517.1 hypothetical protein BABINDRAFT_160792 [Babjeviella inositovora NRRL Y-12698]